MRPLTIVVVGTAASDPYAGMAWMTMQIVAGLRRLGHDAWYYEVTSRWPYDPGRGCKVQDSDYALPYLARLAESFGLHDRWAYRRSYGDKSWFGPNPSGAESRLAGADLVFNVAGATSFAEDGIATGRLVYFGTDPVFHEVRYAEGDRVIRSLVDEHDVVVTYGENIGKPGCAVPPLPRLRARTRQPIVTELWAAEAPTCEAFTTVGNWKQEGRDIELGGETYRWSKHHEFLKVVDLPQRTRQPIELATNLAPSRTIRHLDLDEVNAKGFADGEYEMLARHGWRLVDGLAIGIDPWRYRAYIQASRAEFTVARDFNVRLASGWFSERSACYLAAGRPVVTQDTGFGRTLPLGEGLFAFRTVDDALAAIDAINGDYSRHSRAARDIAHQYFRAETVLSKLIDELS